MKLFKNDICSSKFYSSKNPFRYTTVLNARSHGGSSSIRNFVTLTHDSGNLDINSGTEEQLNVEDALFESTGELEIENSEGENCSNNKTAAPKN